MTSATVALASFTSAECRGRRIGEHVGRRNLAVRANPYSNVPADEAELDYLELLA